MTSRITELIGTTLVLGIILFLVGTSFYGGLNPYSVGAGLGLIIIIIYLLRGPEVEPQEYFGNRSPSQTSDEGSGIELPFGGLIGDVGDSLGAEENEIEDIEQNTQNLEEEFQRLKNEDFEKAARELMQDKNLPEEVREEIGQVYREFEKVEGEDQTLIQVIEDVARKEEVELEHLEEIETLEEEIFQELEEVKQEEQEAERQLQQLKERKNQLIQKLETEEEDAQRARSQGRLREAKNHMRNRKELVRELKELENQFEQLRQGVNTQVGEILQDVKSKHGSLEEYLNEVRQEEESIDQEIKEAEEAAEEISEEGEKEKSMASETTSDASENTSTPQEEQDIEEVFKDVKEELAIGSDAAKVLREEIDEENKEEKTEQTEEQVASEEVKMENKEEENLENIDREAKKNEEEIEEVVSRENQLSREERKELKNEFNQRIKDIENDIDGILSKSGIDLAIPYYYTNVIEKMIEATRKGLENEIIDMEEANLISKELKEATVIVSGIMNKKRSLDHFTACNNLPSVKPVYSNQINVSEFREYTNDLSKAESHVEGLIDIYWDKLHEIRAEEISEPSHINELSKQFNDFIKEEETAEELRKNKELTDLIKEEKTVEDEAARLFIAKHLILAGTKALENEAILKRLNTNLF